MMVLTGRSMEHGLSIPLNGFIGMKESPGRRMRCPLSIPLNGFEALTLLDALREIRKRFQFH